MRGDGRGGGIFLIDNYCFAGIATSSRPTAAGDFASAGSAALHPRLLMARPLWGLGN